MRPLPESVRDVAWPLVAFVLLGASIWAFTAGRLDGGTGALLLTVLALYNWRRSERG
jgi:hypothetical protein